MSISAKELLDYKQSVEEAMKGSKTVYFYNDSILKAMLIQYGILGAGDNNYMPSDVHMYCGHGSLFLASGKNKAYNAKLELDSASLGDEEKEKWANMDLWQDLRNALKLFLEKEHRLELIVDSVEDIREDTELWSLFKSNSRNVSIYHLPVNIGLNHFTASKKSFRVEESDEYKTATCAFNDVEHAQIFFDSFNVLKRYSVAVAL